MDMIQMECYALYPNLLIRMIIMNKIFIYLILTASTILAQGGLKLVAQTKTIYVSAIGDDNNAGSINSPKRTIRGAYDAILTIGSTNEIQTSYNIVLKNEGVIYLSGLDGTNIENLQIVWEKSGKSNKQISIYPLDGTATIIRPYNYGSGSHMFKLTDVDNFHIRNITFENATLAFNLVNLDNSSISYCLFKGSPLNTGDRSGSACVITEIPKSDFNPDTWNDEPGMKSENNSFKYNKFEDLEIVNPLSRHRFHAIYISRGTVNNIFHGNTIFPAPGSGILFNHGFQQFNRVTKNLVYQNFHSIDCTVDDKPSECSRYGISFSGGKDSIDGTSFSREEIRATMMGNFISGNYLFADNKTEGGGDNMAESRNLRYFEGALDSNEINDNHLYYENEGDNRPIDPYWDSYDMTELDNRIVSGDFNGDGFDDIAGFRNLGNCNASIDVWLGGQDKTFDYYPELWWNSNSYGGGYCLSSVNNRIVAGKFDGDELDDIAVFYKYGSDNARIHVFLSNGNSFQYDHGSNGWWNNEVDLGGGYLLDNVANRMISGDFDGDGDDDIATFYRTGGCDSRLHVFKSNGFNKFIFSTSATGTWWDTDEYGGGYCLDAIGSRMVSGDFDSDGDDDVATFYKYGSSNARVHMFLSNGSDTFRFNRGSNGWWNNEVDLGGGYLLDNVANRMISGDFNGDDIDDIATFYKYDDCKARIHIFSSTRSNFQLNNGSAGWWNSEDQGAGYCLDHVEDRIVSGNFFNIATKYSDVVTFYDYGYEKIRNHIFNNNLVIGAESFTYSGALGTPWLQNTLENPNGRQAGSENMDKFKLTSEQVGNNLKVYPNPSSSHFNISYSLKNKSAIKLTFYSLLGETLATYAIENQGIGEYQITVSWEKLEQEKIILIGLETNSNMEYKKAIRMN